MDTVDGRPAPLVRMALVKLAPPPPGLPPTPLRVVADIGAFLAAAVGVAAAVRGIFWLVA